MQHTIVSTPHHIQKVTLRSFAPQSTWQQPEQNEYRVHTDALDSSSNTEPLRVSTPDARCIYVIDRSPLVRSLAETALREAGYETRSFSSGLAAMQSLTASDARRPDLIFVDSDLPGMDGYQVVRAFKSNPGFARTVCILLSDREATVDRFKGKMAGVQSYMTRPFTAQVLLRVTRIALASAAPSVEPV